MTDAETCPLCEEREVCDSLGVDACEPCAEDAIDRQPEDRYGGRFAAERLREIGR